MNTTQVDSVLTNFRFIYQEPIVLEKDSIVLMPMSTQLLNKRSSNFDGFSFGKYSKSSKYNRNYWNVLFHNQKIGLNSLLIKNKVKISGIYVQLGENIHSLTRSNNIFKYKVLYQIEHLYFEQWLSN